MYCALGPGLDALSESDPDFSLRSESIENKRRGNGRTTPGLFDASRLDAMPEQYTENLWSVERQH